jgi:hypothetical protein
LLEAPAEVGRDVVLLTHGRSVTHEDVLAASRRAQKGVRVFAVGVADGGEVALSELRHGAPVVRSRCRVLPSAPIAPSEEPARSAGSESKAPTPPLHTWRGDIEPIPYPFRFGLTGRGTIRALAFDEKGEWVLVAARNGTLHAARTDGSRFEILPRAADKNGAPLTHVEAVFGTAEGFLVCGATNHMKWPTVARYDIAKRAVAVHVLVHQSNDAWEWNYFSELRSIVVRAGAMAIALDLDQGKFSARAAEGAQRVFAGSKDFGVDLDAQGTITAPPWRPFMPLADGKPELAGYRINEVKLAGDVLAASVFKSGWVATELTLRLFHGPEGSPLGTFPGMKTQDKFVLAPTGFYLAREVGGRVEVRGTGLEAEVFSFPNGRFHTDVQVELGAVWLRIRFGRFCHFVSWHDRVLRTRFENAAERVEDRTQPPLPRLAAYDPERFVRVVKGGVTAVVDMFGQVALLDRSGERLLAIFFAHRKQLAAWSPDGTRYGSTALLEATPTVGAAERLGNLLFESSTAGAEA